MEATKKHILAVLIQGCHFLKFSFSLTCFSPQRQFINGIAKSNIDNSYPLTTYGNRTCGVNIS